MTRIIVILLAAAAAIVGIVILTTRSSDDSKLAADTYRVELDSASGLTDDADFRVAGVTVGSIKRLELEASTARAIAIVQVARPEFAPLTKDTSCTIKPQSLIGEYFMDCQPGKDERLKEGGTIPIENTAGTIPPDLVLNVLRKPYREKLSIILGELGQGFAARGGDINETIRRAIPALRETDEVLRILADERETITQTIRDADTVVGALDGNRADVARFIKEAGDTAEISARRRNEIAGTIRRLPRFQQLLRPTLADLGEAARRQTPALRDLRVAAPSLTTLLNRLGPFADASVPATRALGEASVVGTKAVQDARGTISTLRTVATTGKEPITNLRFVLEHLNDRANSVEKNPRSPTGAGFTGLEAVLQYFYVQSQAINIFDSKGYILKLNALINECTAYADGDTALANPERTERCAGKLGNGGKIEPNAPAGGGSGGGDAPPAPAPAAPPVPGAPTLPTVPGAPPLAVPGVTARSRSVAPTQSDKPGPVPAAPGAGQAQRDPAATSNLLDYLLG